MKRKGILIMICAIAVMLLVSCVNQEGNDTNSTSVIKGIKLSGIGDYGLEDYREYGLWSLTIDKIKLTAHEMTAPLQLSVTGEATESFKISGHKVDHSLYICFIPEDISREAIEGGTIWSGAERATQRVGETTLKWVILQDDEIQNGTDLYEMLLTDYIELKKDKTSRVYNNGVLIRPKYVKSSDGNAYTLKYYYDARQVSSEHTAESAFNFLVDRPVSEQNALIFFGNPNRLSVLQSGEEVIEAPDTRERLREVGTEGENEAYTFSQEGERVLFKIWSDNLTNAAYHDAQQYTLDIYGVATDCILLPTGEGDLYEGSITWTLNAGLARNARFTALTDFSGGNGTVNDPYQIGNWKELNNVRDYMGEDVHFMLTTDLSSQTEYYETYVATTVDNPSGWEPIGTDANRFTGHFTGYDGSATHTIADLCIDRTENSDTAIGLFGMVEAATIEQLRLENINVNGFAAVGGLVGSLVSGTITNVEVDGTVNGSINIGGFVGVQVAGSISNSNVSAEVEGDNSVGGFIGKQQGGSITYAYSTGNASGTQYAGGFVGNQYSGSIENAYTTGKASGGYTVGGFAGLITLSSSIVNAYASGNATGTGFEIGGFAGKALGYSFTITHSFWDTDVSEASSDIAIGSSTGVTGKTTAEMKSKSTFEAAGWDFTNDWVIVEGTAKSYPYLQSIPQSPAPGYEKVFADGDGTVNDPYQIGNWKQLNNVRDYMGEDVHFMLTTDLSSQTEYYETYAATTVDNPSGWLPIGKTKAFTGHFTGYDGSATHTIADLCIERTDDDFMTFAGFTIGLFGEVATATIDQLKVENISVKGYMYVGGVIGFLKSGTVTHVMVDGNVTGENVVGGFVGSQQGGAISNACVNANVYGGENANYIGGFVGVKGAGSISNAYATGDVSGDGKIGGFVADHSAGSISNAYATGDVTGVQSVGGFIGVLQGTGTITNVYAVGNVTGTYVDYTGGFVGEINTQNNAVIEQSFWDTDTSGLENGCGNDSPTGLTGETTTNMKKSSTFTTEPQGDWDFDTVWAIVEDSSYPYLQSIPQSPAPGTE